MDRISKAKRSAVMRRIAKTNTHPDLRVRKLLHAM